MVTAIQDTTALLKQLTVNLPEFRDPERLSGVLDEIAEPIRAGKWLIGNNKQEDEFYARKKADEQRIADITSGEPEPTEDEGCMRCSLHGLVLICDGCGSLWHPHCVSLDKVPPEDEEWLCKTCQLLQENDDMDLDSEVDNESGQETDQSGKEEEDDRYQKPDDASDTEQNFNASTAAFITVGDLVTANPNALGLPNGTIRMSDGETFHIAHYLGTEHQDTIRELHAQLPIPQPANMTLQLHEYQLKGIAQLHWAAEKSPFRSLILADEMGLGKTIQGIGAMNLVLSKPGMSLVLAPKQVCPEWLKSIDRSFVDGQKPKAMFLTDPKMTAIQLLALDLDIVIASYEFLDASVRRCQQRDKEFLARREAAHANMSASQSQIPPRRPNTCLFSEVYEITGRKWKRLILDEAQFVSKPDLTRHEAIKNVPHDAIFFLTATPAHNKWYAIWGYLDLMKNHPITSGQLFFHLFGGRSGRWEKPGRTQIKRLQSFLQAVMVCRPRSTDPCLLSKGREDRSIQFDLDRMELGATVAAFGKYQQMLRRNQMDSQDLIYGTNRGTAASQTSKRCLIMAMRAMLASMHPLLVLASVGGAGDDSTDITDGDLVALGTFDSTDDKPHARKKWLEAVAASEYLLEDSTRTTVLFTVFDECRASLPTQKTVIVSQYLKYLDIVEEIFKRRGINPLRFDGTKKTEERVQIQEDFLHADPSIPLLMTAGAGRIHSFYYHYNIVSNFEYYRRHRHQSTGSFNLYPV